MRLVKFVAPRFKGMSNNTIKMHMVLHIHEDILNFGVPEVMNSAYAELSHRPVAKLTIRNTQKQVIHLSGTKLLCREPVHRSRMPGCLRRQKEESP